MYLTVYLSIVSAHRPQWATDLESKCHEALWHKSSQDEEALEKLRSIVKDFFDTHPKLLVMVPYQRRVYLVTALVVQSYSASPPVITAVLDKSDYRELAPGEALN